jgi:general secretion pathway protein G
LLAAGGVGGAWLLFTHPRVLVAFGGLPERGRKAMLERDLRNIITVAEAIHTDTGRYPASLEAMVRARNDDGAPATAFLEKHPQDPWGNRYLYEVAPDGRPRAACLGSDGRPGGDGEAADTVVPAEGGP